MAVSAEGCAIVPVPYSLAWRGSGNWALGVVCLPSPLSVWLLQLEHVELLFLRKSGLMRLCRLSDRRELPCWSQPDRRKCEPLGWPLPLSFVGFVPVPWVVLVTGDGLLSG